jgi:hypothetical protein
MRMVNRDLYASPPPLPSGTGRKGKFFIFGQRAFGTVADRTSKDGTRYVGTSTSGWGSGLMNSPAYYRERAEHYRQAADEEGDPTLREQFDVLASDYDQLAEDAEHGGPNTEKLRK